MKASEIRAKSEADLQELLYELLKEQFNLRMQQGSGQLARPARVKEVRKDIARIKTIVTEMKAGEAR